MKNFDKYFSVLKKQFGSVTSSEIASCAVRVNNIPIFENVIAPDGRLMSDIELSLTKSNDPDVQAYINTLAMSSAPATHNVNWEMPFGTRHMSLARLFDSMQIEDSSESSEVDGSDEVASTVNDNDVVK